MRETAPPNVKGYVAVSPPERRSWQAFYVVAAAKVRGEALLAEARRTGSGEPEGEGLPGVAPQDQAALGALSATLVQLYALATGDPPPAADRAKAIIGAIAGATYALTAITHHPWLLVTGFQHTSAPSGLQTRVDRIEAATLDEARAAMLAEIQRTHLNWGAVEGFTDLVGGKVRPR
ncbi:MAG TPA: hypothetical protein VEA40_12715 [Ramlibacter sp.]|nr:hypothetical protein [Ramlibacter sp.]